MSRRGWITLAAYVVVGIILLAATIWASHPASGHDEFSWIMQNKAGGQTPYSWCCGKEDCHVLTANDPYSFHETAPGVYSFPYTKQVLVEGGGPPQNMQAPGRSLPNGKASDNDAQNHIFESQMNGSVVCLYNPDDEHKPRRVRCLFLDIRV